MEDEHQNQNEDENQQEYTIDADLQIDIPNLNNLLNMYNIQNIDYDNNTTTLPFYLSGNDIPTCGSDQPGYCPVDNISQMFDNTDPLYLSDIKGMKNNIIDILHRRSEFKDEEYDEEKYESKEIDELYEKIKNINQEFKILQEKLHIAEETLKREIDTLNTNSKSLDTFITFLKSLSSDNPQIGVSLKGETKEIIENITDLSSKLAETDSFIKAKKEYVTERKNILKHIYFLRKVNKLNITNMCVVCMEDPVTHFINPCGHTFCSNCLKSHFVVDEIVNDTIYNDKNCPVCRKYVNSVNPLYFL